MCRGCVQAWLKHALAAARAARGRARGRVESGVFSTNFKEGAAGAAGRTRGRQRCHHGIVRAAVLNGQHVSCAGAGRNGQQRAARGNVVLRRSEAGLTMQQQGSEREGRGRTLRTLGSSHRRSDAASALCLHPLTVHGLDGRHDLPKVAVAEVGHHLCGGGGLGGGVCVCGCGCGCVWGGGAETTSVGSQATRARVPSPTLPRRNRLQSQQPRRRCRKACERPQPVSPSPSRLCRTCTSGGAAAVARRKAPTAQSR
jgi:hypothetical protein